MKSRVRGSTSQHTAAVVSWNYNSRAAVDLQNCLDTLRSRLGVAPFIALQEAEKLTDNVECRGFYPIHWNGARSALLAPSARRGEIKAERCNQAAAGVLLKCGVAVVLG